MASEAVEIDVDGHSVRVSNPNKPYFPARPGIPDGVAKLQMVEYYLSVGDGIMRALRDRPTYLERYPDGAEGEQIYQKRVPQRRPEWLETVEITFPSGRSAEALRPTTLAAVAYGANLGTITFHPWPARADDVDHPDELRIDLDPQPGTDFADAVKAGAAVRAYLDELGLAGYPKTSGGRGLHIYIRIEPQWTFTQVRRAALALGREVERRMPDLVTTKWWKEERGERIFVDFNQNARDRTVASAYSVRPKPGAPVSMPVTWDELADVQPEDGTVATMPARFAKVGDLMAALDDRAYSIEPLLEAAERDERDHGLGDAPYPPNYPKMPGEPLRVQPSRKKKED
ncbi:MAG TPA: non-homologous end-joining DNA ligase [Streptosporangiaceae bacterium]|jgi:DNA ligase D